MTSAQHTDPPPHPEDADAALGEGGERTVRLLAARLRHLPAQLHLAWSRLAALAGQGCPPLAPGDGPVLVTGGGLSEGPARLLVALLREAGVRCAYAPLSQFVAPRSSSVSSSTPESTGAAGTLVLFSQGLAPNARFPLLQLSRFRRTLLVTSVDPFAADSSQNSDTASLGRLAARLLHGGVQIVTLPPVREDGLLLRVIGPAVHALAAAYLAGIDLATLAGVPALYEPPPTPGVIPPQGSLLYEQQSGAVPSIPPVALVTSGPYADAVFGLRWKLLEGLHVPDPPIWDALQVAHGPLQSIWHRPHTLLLLARHDAAYEAPLWARIAQVFAAPHHRVLTLRARRLPGLLAYFEHDAALNALLIDALGRAPRGLVDLIDWPGRGHDGPLYGLSPDAAELAALPRRDPRP